MKTSLILLTFTTNLPPTEDTADLFYPLTPRPIVGFYLTSTLWKFTKATAGGPPLFYKDEMIHNLFKSNLIVVSCSRHSQGLQLQGCQHSRCAQEKHICTIAKYTRCVQVDPELVRQDGLVIRALARNLRSGFKSLLWHRLPV